MPSVVGLLEQRELVARRRVDGLREEADRIQAELAAAEQEWQEWAIARRRVDTVLAPDERHDRRARQAIAGSSGMQDSARRRPGMRRSRSRRCRCGVRGWPGRCCRLDYQRILQALADRARLGQGPLTCQEMAVAFGMDVVPARVEALRSKAKRLVARGWLAEPAPGRFTLAKGVAGPGGGS